MIYTIHPRSLAIAGAGLALLLTGLPLAAQDARDPTVAPAETGAMTGQLPKAVEGMSVLVRGDQSFLVVGTRLYAPGDTVGSSACESRPPAASALPLRPCESASMACAGWRSPKAKARSNRRSDPRVIRKS